MDTVYLLEEWIDCGPSAVDIFFCQQSTVDCRQPIRYSTGFSIPILTRFLVIDYNRLWSVDRQLLTFFRRPSAVDKNTYLPK